jgi:hypothetical protein
MFLKKGRGQSKSRPVELSVDHARRSQLLAEGRARGRRRAEETQHLLTRLKTPRRQIAESSAWEAPIERLLVSRGQKAKFSDALDARRPLDQRDPLSR